MLSLNHVSMQFGGRMLFEDISFMIGPHDRIGLVGPNGAGKSTLLKVVTGLAEPERGRVSKAHYVTVGYLPQDGVIASGLTLYHEVESSFDDIVEVRQELDEVYRQFNALDPATEAYGELLEICGELQHKLEELDAFRMKSKIERVLMGLGFSVTDFDRQTEEFSGGWQMRIALAELLLKEPSVLLLDEPTNHLDIESLQWLEEYLYNYNGAIILVSHDRAFLDSLTNKTISISRGRVENYAGNYSFYEKEKEVRRQQLINAQKNQARQLADTQKFIDRFRYKATKARQVQSRIKLLEKIEIIDVENDEEEIRFHFPKPQPSGVNVLNLKNISKRYGENVVFDKVNYAIERGDRIAVVGVNGAGKSTFSRIAAGVEPVDAGERIVGYNVILSYFAQHQAEELDPSKEVLQILDEVAAGAVRTKLRNILGSFLFHGDDAFKKVSVLSGGEKSRLALAKMLLQPANFLIMDEPTNHLDMQSKKILQQALMEYDETYLIVSHDRAFLDPLVNKVLEVTTNGLRTFLGNVSDYLDKKKAEKDAASRIAYPGSQLLHPASHLSSRAQPIGKDRKRLEAEQRRQLAKNLRPLKEKLEDIEKEIDSLEHRKSEIESMMGDPDFYRYGGGANKVSMEYKEIRSKLTEAYHSWNEVTKQIEAVSNGGK